MALRKFYIVVDCDSEQEREQLQQTLNDISNMRAFRASDVIRMRPMFERHRDDLIKLFRMIKQGGVKSLLSIQGGMLLNRLKNM